MQISALKCCAYCRETQSPANQKACTEAQVETKRRIVLAVAAWAYENTGETLLSDAAFDKLAYQIRPEVPTVRACMDAAGKRKARKHDKFFKETFKPYTGQWVNSHPNKGGLRAIYELKRKA